MKAHLTHPILAAACLALLCATSVSLRASTIFVTNTADSGPGTLRDALANAVNGDTIDATGVSGAITLLSDQLYVSSSVTILGPGPGGLTVSGNGAVRVFNVTGSNVTIGGLTIANGGHNSGAGILSGGLLLSVSNCTFSSNNGGTGGGIYNSNAILTVNFCTFNGNTALQGGGIANKGGQGISTLTVNASTFSSNTAAFGGGGILNQGGLNNAFSTNGAVLFVNASTFTANSDRSGVNGGGAIFNSGAQAQINACTFSGNSGLSPGIINTFAFQPAYLEIGDTLFNAGGTFPNITNGASTVISDGYNLSSDNGGGFLTATGDQTNKNPMLGPLQNNGGPTMTHALLPGSPAIDQGKRNAVPSLASNTDQRGFPRPVDNPSIANAPGGDGSDIGAYEEEFSALGLQITNVAGQPDQMNLVYIPWAVGWTYSLQCTTDLTGTAFAPLTGYDGPTTNGNAVTVTDLNATGPQKFYRLQISQP
jgi:hypothetical protein